MHRREEIERGKEGGEGGGRASLPPKCYKTHLGNKFNVLNERMPVSLGIYARLTTGYGYASQVA